VADVIKSPEDALRVVTLDDDATRAVIEPNGQRLPAGGRVLVFAASPDGVSGRQRREVVVDGWRFELEIEPERRAQLRERARRGASQSGTTARLEVRAVIPGRVVAVAVNPGDAIQAGDRLLVIEAMKMQNDVRAPRAGRIARVAVGAGQTVELRDVLVEIE
jgi:biotin carboxyl carrier protein